MIFGRRISIERIKMIIRNKKESILVVFTICFWVLFIGIYFDNIVKNKNLLIEVAKSVPISCEVTDISGKKQNDIEISTTKVDKLLKSKYISNSVYTSSAMSSFSKENCKKNQFDIYLKATNNIKSCLFVNEEDIIFFEGYDRSFLESDKPICIIEKSYLDMYKLNDEIQLPIYTQLYTHSIKSLFDFEYIYNGKVELKIVGTYIDNGLADEPAQVVIPINCLRNIVEQANNSFYYSSMTFNISKPLMLNEVKKELNQIGFSQIRPNIQTDIRGDFITIDDSLFIDRANKIHNTIALYELLQIPFFLLIVLMINVIIFMLIRKKRMSMAISYSLGLSKIRLFYFQFIELVLLCMISMVLDFIVFMIFTELSIISTVILLGIVFVLMLIGIFIGLSQLFKFSIIDILTHSD